MVVAMLCMALPAGAWAADLSIVPGPGGETITLEAGKTSPHKVFTLPNPDRLVVDLPRVSDPSDIALPSAYKGDLVKQVRTGLFNPATTRVVFDLRRPVQVKQSRERSGRLLIEIARPGAPEKMEEERPSLAPQTAKPGKDQVSDTASDLPHPEKKARAENKKTEDKKQEDKKAKKPEARAFNPPKSTEKPMVVIDPGHGGVDPGASGEKGGVEKDIVLEYAEALKARLLKSGHYRVALTRDNDEFIMLRQRVAIARQQGADIFISLHADSAPGGARGLSVYTVSEKASDEEAQALAARENKADVLSGMNLATEREDVADILISLAERETKNRSATLADMLVSHMDGSVKLLPDAHRFAGFAVLKAPDVPSVLIELGFLSHPQEEKLINSKVYRDKVVSSIARGIDSYFQKEKTLWTR